MSIKHVKEEYHKRQKNVTTLLETLQKFKEDTAITQERYQELIDNISPWVNDLKRWDYIMLLLNKPSNKKKQDEYDEQHKKDVEEFEEQGLTSDQVEEQIHNTTTKVEEIVDDILQGE